MMECRWLICQDPLCKKPFRYPVGQYRAHCFECGGEDEVFHWASLLTTAALGICMLALLAWRVGWL